MRAIDSNAKAIQTLVANFRRESEFFRETLAELTDPPRHMQAYLSRRVALAGRGGHNAVVSIIIIDLKPFITY